MRYLFILIVTSIALSSCRKPDEYPVEPIITYKSIYSTRDLQGYDLSLTVLLNFTDGDGDVGYKPSPENGPVYDDATSEYYRNYQATLFQFINNEWVAQTSIIPYGGRLPYLTPETKNKGLKGEIACDLDVPLGAVNDTFRFDIFIYDRGLHKSNVVTTESIILTTH